MTISASSIQRILAAEMRIPIEHLRLHQSVESLGLDSLTFAEIVIAIEQKLQCSIDTTKLSIVNSHTTLGEVIELIASAAAEATTAAPEDDVTRV